MGKQATKCEECNEPHIEPEISYCKKCGACLYMNGKQVWDKEKEPDGPMHPIIECKKCGTRVFWD